jgi:glycine C-acetyltransferase
MGKTGAKQVNHSVFRMIWTYTLPLAKSFAGIGGFVAGDKDVISYLRFNLRSQIYAKSLPMAMTVGAIKRLEMMKNHPEFREKLWEIANALQKGFREAGFDLGKTQSPVTPVFFNGELAVTTQLIKDLRKNHGIFCSVVIYPVVPKGVIMLMDHPDGCPYTMEDVNYTLQAFKEVKKKLETNAYPNVLATSGNDSY